MVRKVFARVSKENDGGHMARTGSLKDDFWIFPGPRLHNTPQACEDELFSLAGSDRDFFEMVCANLPSGKEYVERNKSLLGWPVEVLSAAKEYTPAELARPVPYFPVPWECFRNSFFLADEYKLRYMEGVVITPRGAYIHAWVRTTCHEVVDLTYPLQHLNRYYGVELDTEKLREIGCPEGGVLAYFFEKTCRERENEKEHAA